MLMQRDRRPVPAFALPAPLPSLSDALQRRAAVFGPFDADPAPVIPRGFLARYAATLRQAADIIEPGR